MEVLFQAAFWCSLLSSLFGFEVCNEVYVDGYKLDGYLVATLRDIGPSSCIKECLSRPNHCMSVNFDREHFICELNSEAVDVTVDGTEKKASAYIQMTNQYMVHTKYIHLAVSHLTHKNFEMYIWLLHSKQYFLSLFYLI